MPPESPAELDEWFHARAAAPGQHGLEVVSGVFTMLVVPKLGEELAQGEAAGDALVLTCDLFALCALVVGESFEVAAQSPHRSTGQATVLAGHLLADAVERFAAELHDMKPVEADLRVGEVLSSSGDECPGHVDGDLLDLRGRHAPPLQFGGELREGVAILSRSEEQQQGDLGGTAPALGLLAGDFEENRAVFVSLAGGGLVAAKPFKRAPVGSLPGGFDPGADQVDSRTKMRPSSKWISDVTVAEMLKEAGYRTGFVGKWGLGLPGSTGAPHKQGFDLAYGFYDQHRAHGFFPNYMMRNGEVENHPENHGFNMKRLYQYGRRPVDNLDDVANRYDENGRLIADGVADPKAVSYSEDLFEREALKFIREKREQPFFLYYASQLPHGPLIIPELGEFRDKPWSLKHKEWAAMVTRLDRTVGSMVATLRELGIEKDTVIFFAGDNGYSQWGYFGRSRWEDDPVFRNKGPWPEGKFSSTHEGGMRVPFFASWPGTIRAGESDHVCALYDFAATAAVLAGVEPPETDGISLVPTLLGKPGEQKAHPYFYWANEVMSVHAQSTRFGSWWACRPHPSKPVEVYNLKADPGCVKNLAYIHPELVARAEKIFTEAHTPSQWYVNPGETADEVKSKARRGRASKGMTQSTGPNQRTEPRKPQ